MASTIASREDLIKKMAEKINITQKSAREALGAFEEVMVETISNGDGIIIKGLGRFLVKERGERKGRNPKTGEEVAIPAHKALTFKVAPSIKETLK